MKPLFENVDKTIFGGAASIYLALFLFIILLPQTAETVIKAGLNFTINQLGWLYLLSFSAIVVFLLVVALGRFGQMRLGSQDDRPEYPFASWLGMLFGAGLGVGLVFFGVYEPVIHFINPPLGPGGTAEAGALALGRTFFHWGLHPWAMYTAAGLSIAYFQHRRGLPGRVSSAFEPMLGREGLSGPVAKIIDIFSMVAILCGVATSVGFAASQFAAGLASQYGFTKNLTLVAVTIIIIGTLSTVSALRGVAKGIKIISDGNMILIAVLIVFIIFAGPTQFQFNSFFQTLGWYLNNLPRLGLYMDANGQMAAQTGYNWVGAWTVTYFAWWAAFAPFVGGFLANISKGRTVREFILACTIVPAVLCLVWFTCYGGSAIQMSLTGAIKDVAGLTASSDESLFNFLVELPFSKVTVFLAMFLIQTLIITSLNSATYVMGVMSSGAREAEPSLGVRAFWGIFISVNARLFLEVGGMEALRNSSMVGAMPFMIILVLMLVNTYRAMAAEGPKPPRR